MAGCGATRPPPRPAPGQIPEGASMARIRALTEAEAPDEVRALFARNRELYGQVLNSTGVYAHRPGIQLGVRALADAVAGSGLIPARLRFLLNVRVAGLVGCPF